MTTYTASIHEDENRKSAAAAIEARKEAFPDGSPWTPGIESLLRHYFGPDFMPGVYLSHVLVPLQYDLEDFVEAAYNLGRLDGWEMSGE
jgi:hypothetical protein